jgi:RNA polymerase sigma factor (sigma-70 family)
VSDDVAAQVEGLYRKWSGALVGYALSWTGGDRDEAEGLVDEAFHELYRQWDRVTVYNNQGQYGWLRTVTRNRAVSAYRKRHGMPVLIDPLKDRDLDDWHSFAILDRPSLADDPDDPVQALLTCEHRSLARHLVDECMAVIQTMPERMRIAILLRGDGCTSQQIATQMGVDASTVRGYWKKAIKELTAKVGDVIKILDKGDEQENGEETR